MNIFLSCTKSKLDKRAKAIDMYSESELFTRALTHARKKHPSGDIYILSAKHHVLRPDDVIDPYNVTTNDFDDDELQAWADKVIGKCKDLGIDFEDKTYFYCGNNYHKYLTDHFKNHEIVFDKWEGMGYIMQGLEDEVKESMSLYDFIHLQESLYYK